MLLALPRHFSTHAKNTPLLLSQPQLISARARVFGNGITLPYQIVPLLLLAVRKKVFDTSTPDFELCVCNIVACFSYPYTFNMFHALAWYVVTTVTVHHCSVQGTTVNGTVSWVTISIVLCLKTIVEEWLGRHGQAFLISCGFWALAVVLRLLVPRWDMWYSGTQLMRLNSWYTACRQT